MHLEKECSRCSQPYTCEGDCSNAMRNGGTKNLKCYCLKCLREHIEFLTEKGMDQYFESRKGCPLMTEELKEAMKVRPVWKKLFGDTDDHIFLRCWDLKGKKLEELREITRMVI